jgi:hypothetical protein
MQFDNEMLIPLCHLDYFTFRKEAAEKFQRLTKEEKRSFALKAEVEDFLFAVPEKPCKSQKQDDGIIKRKTCAQEDAKVQKKSEIQQESKDPARVSSASKSLQQAVINNEIQLIAT